jgi:hypothetical protein
MLLREEIGLYLPGFPVPSSHHLHQHLQLQSHSSHHSLPPTDRHPLSFRVPHISPNLTGTALSTLSIGIPRRCRAPQTPAQTSNANPAVVSSNHSQLLALSPRPHLRPSSHLERQRPNCPQCQISTTLGRLLLQLTGTVPTSSRLPSQHTYPAQTPTTRTRDCRDSRHTQGTPTRSKTMAVQTTTLLPKIADTTRTKGCTRSSSISKAPTDSKAPMDSKAPTEAATEAATATASRADTRTSREAGGSQRV